MNVDNGNDFQIAVLGAYYFVDMPGVRKLASSNLADVYKVCLQAEVGASVSSPMVTLSDILSAMSSPPSGSQIKCSLHQIQAMLPGISPPTGSVVAPAWTDRVNSECFMIGPDTYPYYCQIWYDWNRGIQVTVFVFKDDNGMYTHRADKILPRGTVGPAVVYSWNGSQWTPSCCVDGGGVVPMPVPNFVQAGDGKCRALIKNNAYFGDLSIWSVALGDGNGQWKSDFWYWFNENSQGVIFSLAPATSLTSIDYQTFVQNGNIDACIFENPCQEIPACPDNKMAMVKDRPAFSAFGFIPGS
jgi:hypothetical protein